MNAMSIVGIVIGVLLLATFVVAIGFVIRRNTEQTESVTHQSPNTQPPDSVANSRTNQRPNEDRIRAMSEERQNPRRRSDGPRA